MFFSFEEVNYRIPQRVVEKKRQGYRSPFEELVRGLPDNMADIMIALFLEGATWDNVEEDFLMNRRNIAECRKKSVSCLVRMY